MRSKYRRKNIHISTRHLHSAKRRRLRPLPILILAVLIIVLVISLSQLIGYWSDLAASRRASEELRAVYYAATDVPTAVSVTDTPAPTMTPLPTIPGVTPIPQSGSNTLPTVRYPGNFNASISSRFQKLRRQNSDIIGWLTVPGLVDEAVVQRDNAYYLDRDYRGYHNVNGAIFLDEDCALSTRPYTLTLYGHNMKTGAMFGSLRNYENITYYKNNPFITFDTAYEDGRYVIFSVSTVSTNARDIHFLDFAKLQSQSTAWRQDALDMLRRRSVFTSVLDVQPSDQILLLVTCVDDEEDRRVIAARRIRDGESESALQTLVNKSQKKQ